MMTLEDVLSEPNGMEFECLECGEDLGENMGDIGPTSDVVRIETDVNDTTSKIWWFCSPVCFFRLIDRRLSNLPMVAREEIYEDE